MNRHMWRAIFSLHIISCVIFSDVHAHNFILYTPNFCLLSLVRKFSPKEYHHLKTSQFTSTLHSVHRQVKLSRVCSCIHVHHVKVSFSCSCTCKHLLISSIVCFYYFLKTINSMYIHVYLAKCDSP